MAKLVTGFFQEASLPLGVQIVALDGDRDECGNDRSGKGNAHELCDSIHVTLRLLHQAFILDGERRAPRCGEHAVPGSALLGEHGKVPPDRRSVIGRHTALTIGGPPRQIYVADVFKRRS